MKMPKTFIPEKNLDEKVKNMILKSEYKEDTLEKFDRKLKIKDKKYDYYCDKCEEHAGSIEIYLGNEDIKCSPHILHKISCWPTFPREKDPLDDKPRIITKSYIGECKMPKKGSELIEIMQYLENDELDSVLAIFKGDHMAFYCPNCDKCYCENHYDTKDIYDDGGWYDHTMGTCPERHERILNRSPIT
ncbi:MAG: hypothetical protein KKA79_02065 [Nanoarchaeota archaeon]|nr:hypothetical protein [Nanoarchaeota archaeon]MCG2717376.1 hypothetical protein [Nanoarchaeota archaeon]